MSLFRTFVEFFSGTFSSDSSSTSSSGPRINPSTGLPMVENSGLDVAGNAYGTGTVADPFRTSASRSGGSFHSASFPVGSVTEGVASFDHSHSSADSWNASASVDNSPDTSFDSSPSTSSFENDW